MLRATRSNDIGDGTRFYTSPGECKQKQYQLEYDANGNKVLREVGEIDIPDMINSYSDDCDINRIVRKHAGEIAAGDLSCLNMRTPTYGDAVGSSTNLADYHNSHAILKGAFESDAESFEKFNGDFSAYLADRARALGSHGADAKTTEGVKEVSSDES